MDEAARGRLAAWLGRAAGAPVRVERMAQLSGGAIQQNWALDVMLGGSAQAWVLRTDNPATLAVSLPRAAEFALLRTAFAAGVTVPQPLHLCEDASVTGRPFFTMQRVTGLAQAHRLARQAAARSGDAGLVEALGRQLARIHRIRPPQPDLAFLGAPPADPAAEFIARMRAAIDRAGTPRPVLEWGLRAMERHAPPPPAAIVLNHNDFRTGNYMVADGQVTGVLDWEFAAWGDPAADLGWFCAPCWRFGNAALEAGGIGPRAAFLAGYEAEAGAPVDQARLPWWELAATIRWAVVAYDQAGRHLRGGETSLELALTGHIGPELEWDVLRMTEALDAGTA